MPGTGKGLTGGNMKHMRAMMLGVALVMGATTFAAAQAVVQVQWGYHDDDDRQAFREGFKQGQWDAQHNRRFDPDKNRWREGDDRRAFRSGYERGFREVGSYYGNDRDRDRDHDGWGRGGYGGSGLRVVLVRIKLLYTGHHCGMLPQIVYGYPGTADGSGIAF